MMLLTKLKLSISKVRITFAQLSKRLLNRCLFVLLTLVFLVMALSACTTLQQKTQFPTPPAELMQPPAELQLLKLPVPSSKTMGFATKRLTG